MVIEALSKRESEVCELVSRGFSNEQIGRKLDITVLTVKTHLRNIYSKSGTNNRTNLVLKFLKNN